MAGLTSKHQDKGYTLGGWGKGNTEQSDLEVEMLDRSSSTVRANQPLVRSDELMVSIMSLPGGALQLLNLSSSCRSSQILSPPHLPSCP